ncbi:hypothetical protein SAMN02745121_06459 [Nannocystis exedens]|uniref:Uncharacterized protein n=1 Tax=Nannocystis exedens TaxID=54 RepID=A0A1I2F6U0_9BACT|nr:hypothetical protein [Nannocystis exedens]PCC73079.1 hypothetical protein NAEX_06165 [Nannocystis exedens]SFF00557.1 hypothetical protein SAMN02745121_06459 [Nannocystis exedens]
MPSLPHTVLLELLRRAPPLVATLLREGCAAPLPRFTAAQVVEGEFAEIDPAEVRADLVLALTGEGGRPALAIVVEAQLRRDPAKRWVWPVYLASLRRRLQCPVRLLVLTTRPAVARWCSRPIDMGDGCWCWCPTSSGRNRSRKSPASMRPGAGRSSRSCRCWLTAAAREPPPSAAPRSLA